MKTITPRIYKFKTPLGSIHIVTCYRWDGIIRVSHATYRRTTLLPRNVLAARIRTLREVGAKRIN